MELACLPLSSKKRSPYAPHKKASKLQARMKEIQQSLEYKLKCHIDGGNFDAEMCVNRSDHATCSVDERNQIIDGSPLRNFSVALSSRSLQSRG
jgi:hypothetical protein